eukprot:ANDGO_05021.mRNA.1 hypothetical protein
MTTTMPAEAPVKVFSECSIQDASENTVSVTSLLTDSGKPTAVALVRHLG